MAERNVNPVIKQVLELGPTVIFFLLYMRIKDEVYTFAGTEYSGFIVATVAFVPVLLIAMGILWALTGKLSRIQMFTAFMVIVFGGLTAYFNNSTFFKMKTTIVYGLFAALLGIGLWRGQSWLELFMGEMVPMEQEGWMILTKRLAMMFAVLAVANEIIWRTMSEQTWVTIETFAFPVAMFVFLWSQFMILQKYLIEPDKS
jgi:intracellular septation protein